MKFFVCAHCKKIVTEMHETKVPLMCCGEKMSELIPGTTDAAVEKHVPVVEVKDSTVHVAVGEVSHPMTDEHYIEWIVLETNLGFHVRKLTPADAPKACFNLCKCNPEKPEEVVAVYEFCNLHGLWKA